MGAGRFQHPVKCCAIDLLFRTKIDQRFLVIWALMAACPAARVHPPSEAEVMLKPDRQSADFLPLTQYFLNANTLDHILPALNKVGLAMNWEQRQVCIPRCPLLPKHPGVKLQRLAFYKVDDFQDRLD